jgi:hypothetical protein
VFCDIATLTIKVYDWQLKIKTGVLKFWSQITLAIQFCAMTPNIYRPSVWTLLPVTYRIEVASGFSEYFCTPEVGH